jgi:3-oxoacyl-[acyl-carrier protein] reductase
MGTPSISPQTALVTGASRGIGAAIALHLARQGFHVCGTATSEEGASRIAGSLAAFAGCQGVVLQVNDADQLQAVVDRLVEQTGGLHVLVNNAGITRDTLAMRMKDSDWDDVIDTNLKAVFRLCRAVMRPMMKQRFGRIINITSVVGASGNPGQANYAAAKAGVAGMTKALARELGSRGITVNCVKSPWGTSANPKMWRRPWHFWRETAGPTSPVKNCTSMAACTWLNGLGISQ